MPRACRAHAIKLKSCTFENLRSYCFEEVQRIFRDSHIQFGSAEIPTSWRSKELADERLLLGVPYLE